MAAYLLITVFFLIGLWAVLVKRNLVKKIIGLGITSSAIVILFVYGGSEGAETAPILIGDEGVISDPIPQALMLTAIVIGVCLTALALGLVYRLFLRYNSLDVGHIESEARDE